MPSPAGKPPCTCPGIHTRAPTARQNHSVSWSADVDPSYVAACAVRQLHAGVAPAARLSGTHPTPGPRHTTAAAQVLKAKCTWTHETPAGHHSQLRLLCNAGRQAAPHTYTGHTCRVQCGQRWSSCSCATSGNRLRPQHVSMLAGCAMQHKCKLLSCLLPQGTVCTVFWSSPQGDDSARSATTTTVQLPASQPRPKLKVEQSA